MRKINIKRTFNIQLDSIKATLRKYKRLLFIGSGFAVLGLLFSLFGINDYTDNNAKQSIFFLINSGEFSVIIFELTLLVYILIPFAICYLLSLNYFLFLLSFPVISVTCYFIFRYILATFVCGFFYGLLSFLFILLPVMCLIFLGLIIFIARTIELIKFPPCKKFFSITPYAFHFRTMKRYILNYLFYIAIPSFIYSNLIIIIAFLICGA